MRGTLSGLRVLDLSRLLPGPFLTQLLAELGADVVKVEAPLVGDDTRAIPYAFDALNAGKRSIALDLKRPEGAEVVRRLAERADVLVESFRPGVMARFGLADEALAAANPRLVRVSLVGYPEGEYRDDVGHDLNYQALAGILTLGGEPRPPPSQVADLGGALYGATAVLAALYERERTGRGRRVEVALADAALAFNLLPIARSRSADAGGGDWELTGTMPCYRVYRCADGAFLAFAALEPKFFARFAALTGASEADQFDVSREAHARLEALFASRTASEWVAVLRKAGVPATPILAPGAVEAPAGAASPLTGASPAGRPPALGEHAEALLRELGYSPEEAARLRDPSTSQ